jgi:hypothetical protein
MATTNFVDKVTVIQADWLNDVDAVVYGDPVSLPQLAAPDGATLVGANAYQTQDEINLEHVTVDSKGATGDGLADDTAAIQTALGLGKTVYGVPGKTYRITSGLTATVAGSVLDLNGA